MSTTYWSKQSEKPLFPELEWDKPERRDQAGKILIIGGDQHNLGAPASAYDTVKKLGPSAVQIALPNKTKRLVGTLLPEALFLPSTPSGEFSLEGERELLEHAAWADTILLPGDNGRNSQTTILFQELLEGYKGNVIATRDAVDTLSNNAAQLFERPRTTLVVTFAQLQKLIKNYGEPTALVFSMDLIKLVTTLHRLSEKIHANIVTLHQNQLVVASKGAVSSTKLSNTTEAPHHWRIEVASMAACFHTWYPLKQFESLTHTAYLLKLGGMA